MSQVHLTEADVDSQFEKAKSYLMCANRDGISVYDQLTRLMELLLDENPDNVANDPVRFEEILTLLQKYSFVRGESSSGSNEAPSKPPQELQRLSDNRALFERLAPEVHTTIEQPDPYTTVTTTTTKPLTAPQYESVVEQNRFWASAGCGMPEEEAFLLDRSITKLTMEKNLEEVRFVGKVFGLRGNYLIISSKRYVADGEKIYQEVNTMPKAPRKAGTVPVQAEPGYVGVNRVSFWVASHPSAAWRLLPDVTPQQINAARAIKRLFTGNLEAEVVASPPFPWDEAVYLRAQLARIVSGTYIAPNGALEEAEPLVEDEEEDDEDEEGPPKPKEAKYQLLTTPAKDFAEEETDVAQFITLDQWVHAENIIFKNGRQTKVPPKPETDEEDEEEEEPQRNADEEDEEAEEGEGDEDEGEEEEEEEEQELFVPIRNDHLFCAVDIPQPPPPIDDEEDEIDEEEEEEEAKEPVPEDNKPVKPTRDEDIADDDATKMKVAAWTVRLAGNISSRHRVAVVQSLHWPGAVAYIGENGKRWGCAYFGTGLKKTEFAFTPTPAPIILKECADLTEVMDPTAAVEKLVRRGEEVPMPDSEDEEMDEEAESDGPEM